MHGTLSWRVCNYYWPGREKREKKRGPVVAPIEKAVRSNETALGDPHRDYPYRYLKNMVKINISQRNTGSGVYKLDVRSYDPCGMDHQHDYNHTP